jgi:hypothetical protein
LEIRVITKLPNSKSKSKLTNIQTDKISQQPENCENRNDPDLVTRFIYPQRNMHTMDFHIVKMYKDKWSTTKMSIFFFIKWKD